MRKFLLVVILLIVSAPSWSAVCTITEHRDLYRLPSGLITPMPDAPYRRQAVTYTTSTQAANAFSNATNYVGITCNALAHYKMSSSPTAIATDTIIPANATVYFPITRGDKIAFYDGSS